MEEGGGYIIKLCTTLRTPTPKHTLEVVIGEEGCSTATEPAPMVVVGGAVGPGVVKKVA